MSLSSFFFFVPSIIISLFQEVCFVLLCPNGGAQEKGGQHIIPPCTHRRAKQGPPFCGERKAEHGGTPTCVSLSLGSSAERAADASSKAFPVRTPCRCDASKRPRADRRSARVLTSWQARQGGRRGGREGREEDGEVKGKGREWVPVVKWEF